MTTINQKDGLASPPISDKKSDLTYFQTILYGILIGTIGGLVATIYYFVLENLLDIVWEEGKEFWLPLFPTWLPAWNYTWIIATIGGLLVGLCLYFLGLPGEMAMVIDKVHDPGRLEPRQTPGMIITSLVSITAGGSLGPEAPLVQVNGSLGSWLGDRLNLSMKSIRILTFCGMSAALGAFFGAPIGGALFALEIPHRRSLEYYEAIVPAVIASIFSFAMFRFGTGLEVGGIYRFELFDTLPPLTYINMLQGLALGAIGAAAGVLFVGIFRCMGWLIAKLEDNHILLAVLGGLGIGWIAVLFPQTLFFSEQQIQTEVIEAGAALGVVTLLCITLAKMFAISFTIHGGFRGGFIFPLFFTGANLGLAISLARPDIHPTIAMLCCMAAINVAITKTPISTSIILGVLTDTSILPIVAIASFTSLLLTNNVSLLKTQRSRTVATETVVVSDKLVPELELSPVLN
ncbi:chloride channel protein EriC [Xenococcus sp. PCC 7305]|uniref:chloride channel protein n=1 Tax=Xenococcus sp. PCC 7305 TaxID=102125 RepID=UPI0002ABB791|nr:chloride channel protein [Xenococcus sp. PCC 7305]ELS01400.1 chloride channel protein EriC [Xenococcus sp. PCC 7305]